MTQPDLATRRRAIRIRANRRGLRELDILLGGFVEAEVEKLDAREIADLEALLEANDQEVFAWLGAFEPVPAEYDTPLFRRIVAFHRHDGPVHI